MFPYENGTTGIKNLDFNSFIQEQDISIPDIKTQQKIVSILSSIDEKIETNKRINDNLEEQDRKSTRLNSSHMPKSRMPSSA